MYLTAIEHEHRYAEHQHEALSDSHRRCFRAFLNFRG